MLDLDGQAKPSPTPAAQPHAGLPPSGSSFGPPPSAAKPTIGLPPAKTESAPAKTWGKPAAANPPVNTPAPVVNTPAPAHVVHTPAPAPAPVAAPASSGPSAEVVKVIRGIMNKVFVSLKNQFDVSQSYNVEFILEATRTTIVSVCFLLPAHKRDPFHKTFDLTVLLRPPKKMKLILILLPLRRF